MKTNEILGYLPEYMPKEDSSNNYKFVNSFSAEFSLVDYNIEELKKDIQISTATGEALEDIGRLFGLKRDIIESDTDFRSRILSFWQSYIKGGVIDSIIYVVREITGSTEVNYDDSNPMIVTVSATLSNLDVNLETLTSTVNSVKPAGIKIYLNLSSSYQDYYNEYSDSYIITEGLGFMLPDYYLPDSTAVLL